MPNILTTFWPITFSSLESQITIVRCCGSCGKDEANGREGGGRERELLCERCLSWRIIAQNEGQIDRARCIRLAIDNAFGESHESRAAICHDAVHKHQFV